MCKMFLPIPSGCTSIHASYRLLSSLGAVVTSATPASGILESLVQIETIDLGATAFLLYTIGYD